MPAAIRSRGPSRIGFPSMPSRTFRALDDSDLRVFACAPFRLNPVHSSANIEFLMDSSRIFVTLNRSPSGYFRRRRTCHVLSELRAARPARIGFLHFLRAPNGRSAIPRCSTNRRLGCSGLLRHGRSPPFLYNHPRYSGASGRYPGYRGILPSMDNGCGRRTESFIDEHRQ